MESDKSGKDAKVRCYGGASSWKP